MSDPRIPIARDWMHEPELVLTSTEDIFRAIDRLLSARVAAAPVLDGDRVAGVFTEKDSLRALSRLLYNESANMGTVGDHMSVDFPRCGPEMDFFRIAQTFLGCNFPSLPVIEGDRFLGMIDRRALLASVDAYRRELETSRSREASVAGRQADRPRGIGATQRVAAQTTREQLVRLFSRRKN